MPGDAHLVDDATTDAVDQEGDATTVAAATVTVEIETRSLSD